MSAESGRWLGGLRGGRAVLPWLALQHWDRCMNLKEAIQTAKYAKYATGERVGRYTRIRWRAGRVLPRVVLFSRHSRFGLPVLA